MPCIVLWAQFKHSYKRDVRRALRLQRGQLWNPRRILQILSSPIIAAEPAIHVQLLKSEVPRGRAWLLG